MPPVMIVHNLTLCALFSIVLINGLFFKTRIFYAHDCAWPAWPLTAFALCLVYLLLRARAGSLHAAQLSAPRLWMLPALDALYAGTLTLEAVTLRVYTPWAVVVSLGFIALLLAICPPKLFFSAERNIADYTRTKWFLFGMLIPILVFYFQFAQTNEIRDESPFIKAQAEQVFNVLNAAIEKHIRETAKLPETLLGGTRREIEWEGHTLKDPIFALYPEGGTPDPYEMGLILGRPYRPVREFVDDANVLEWVCLPDGDPRLGSSRRVCLNVGLGLEKYLSRFHRIGFPPQVKHPFPQQFFYRSEDRNGDGEPDWAVLGMFGGIAGEGDPAYDVFGRNGEFSVRFEEGEPVFTSADGHPDGFVRLRTFELN